jgi:antitoxin component of RelBE/YafQ-DinJ toxin-antitoxin module
MKHRTKYINFKTDPKTKQKFNEVCSELGIRLDRAGEKAIKEFIEKYDEKEDQE